MSNQLMTQQAEGFMTTPKTMDDAYRVAEILSKSQLIPKAYQGRPNDVLVSMMWSHNLDVPFIQGIQGIACINGKPAIYGDMALAVVRKSGLLKDIKETVEKVDGVLTARCEVTRKDQDSKVVSSFSWDDAVAAGLIGKQGPWKQYPKRMLQMRARGFALRDAFPDVLMGMITAEEASDYEYIDQDGEITKEVPAKKMPSRKSKPQQKVEDVADVSPVALTAPTTSAWVEQEDDSALEQSNIHATPAESVEPTEPSEPVEPNGWLMDMELKLEEINDLHELAQLYRSLTPEQQAQIKPAFSKRRAEIEKL